MKHHFQTPPIEPDTGMVLDYRNKLITIGGVEIPTDMIDADIRVETPPASMAPVVHLCVRPSYLTIIGKETP